MAGLRDQTLVTLKAQSANGCGLYVGYIWIYIPVTYGLDMDYIVIYTYIYICACDVCVYVWIIRLPLGYGLNGYICPRSLSTWNSKNMSTWGRVMVGKLRGDTSASTGGKEQLL